MSTVEGQSQVSTSLYIHLESQHLHRPSLSLTSSGSLHEVKKGKIFPHPEAESRDRPGVVQKDTSLRHRRHSNLPWNVVAPEWNKLEPERCGKGRNCGGDDGALCGSRQQPRGDDDNS